VRSVKQTFQAMVAVLLLPAAVLLVAAYQVGAANDRVAEVNRTRYQSYLLADELRQSSDDLTRLARTYVVSADPEWEKQYIEILDIRNGKKPRPKEYEKIYWDFRAAGTDGGRGTGATIALESLMKDAGFTAEEFAKLKEAQGNSDDLVKTETIAMGLVKTNDEAELAKARAMMHDKNYHLFKAKIMKPVDQFLTLLDARTQGEVDAALSRKNSWYSILILAVLANIVLAIGVLWLMTRSVLQRLGGEPSDVRDAAEAVRQGDLTTSLQVPHGDTSSVMSSMKTMRDQLALIVSNVRQSAESVATASTEIAQGNNDLSTRTEQQAGALETTTQSMQGLGATVKQNADSARQANQLAMSASTVAVKGGEVVGQVVETMKGINESSRKIADIIGVIDGIAFQTNILALNAAVEAARAGEQGRGFAVVASEVRSLAGRSADAAKEIKSLISASVERVEQGTALVDQAGSTMTEVVGSIRRVTDIMGEIAAASNEQASSVTQIGQAIGQMDQATQQNAAMVEQMAAAASGMKSQADDLVQSVAVFRLPEHMAQPAKTQVRAPMPKASSFKGAERRTESADGAAAAAKPAIKRPVALAAAVAPLPTPKPAAKTAPTGGDDEWETF